MRYKIRYRKKLEEIRYRIRLLTFFCIPNRTYKNDILMPALESKTATQPAMSSPKDNKNNNIIRAATVSKLSSSFTASCTSLFVAGPQSPYFMMARKGGRRTKVLKSKIIRLQNRNLNFKTYDLVPE